MLKILLSSENGKNRLLVAVQNYIRKSIHNRQPSVFWCYIYPFKNISTGSFDRLQNQRKRWSLEHETRLKTKPPEVCHLARVITLSLYKSVTSLLVLVSFSVSLFHFKFSIVISFRSKCHHFKASVVILFQIQ